jgi:hypothetical protein
MDKVWILKLARHLGFGVWNFDPAHTLIAASANFSNILK